MLSIYEDFRRVDVREDASRTNDLRVGKSSSSSPLPRRIDRDKVSLVPKPLVLCEECSDLERRSTLRTHAASWRD